MDHYSFTTSWNPLSFSASYITMVSIRSLWCSLIHYTRLLLMSYLIIIQWSLQLRLMSAFRHIFIFMGAQSGGRGWVMGVCIIGAAPRISPIIGECRSKIYLLKPETPKTYENCKLCTICDIPVTCVSCIYYLTTTDNICFRCMPQSRAMISLN